MTNVARKVETSALTDLRSNWVPVFPTTPDADTIRSIWATLSESGQACYDIYIWR